MPLHVCGPCGQQFAEEEQYLDHVCEASGVTPRHPENVDAEWLDVHAKLKQNSEE